MSGEMETEQIKILTEEREEEQGCKGTTVAESLGLKPLELLEGAANAVRSLGMLFGFGELRSLMDLS
jgi:hypothetical protein